MTKFLARLFIVHGGSYTRKFADKSGGFVIMRHRLKRWWHLPPLWLLCFSILFGKDVAHVDLEKSLDGSELSHLFPPSENLKIVFPEILPVITGMLQIGLKAAVMRGNISTPALTPNDDDALYLARPRATSMNTSIPPGNLCPFLPSLPPLYTQ